MDVTLRIRGDQLGTFAGFAGVGNNDDRVLTLDDVEAVGSASDTFIVLVEQVNTGVNEFQNGQFVTITDTAGNTVVPRTNIQPDREQGLGAGDEHLVLFNDGYVIDLGGVPATATDVEYTIADETAEPGVGDNDGNLDFAAFPCLAAGTLITTPKGMVRVEDLRPGDFVAGPEGFERRVLWIGQRTITLVPDEDDQRPIRFAPGSLGSGLPERALVVSQGHRMCLSGALPARLFGVDTVLPVANGLRGLKGVSVMRGIGEVTYVSVLLDKHAVMLAEGVLTESFYPGPYGMRQLGHTMRKDVAAAIPGFAEYGHAAYGPLAYRTLRLQEARQLIKAHRTALEAPDDARVWEDLRADVIAGATVPNPGV